MLTNLAPTHTTRIKRKDLAWITESRKGWITRRCPTTISGPTGLTVFVSVDWPGSRCWSEDRSNQSCCGKVQSAPALMN